MTTETDILDDDLTECPLCGKGFDPELGIGGTLLHLGPPEGKERWSGRLVGPECAEYTPEINRLNGFSKFEHWEASTEKYLGRKIM